MSQPLAEEAIVKPASGPIKWSLVLGSLGVVYGDIGTSPLYAFREALHAAAGGATLSDPTTVLGVLSLMLWALIIIVTVKYVGILLCADNNGEGGTLSLMALAQNAIGKRSRHILIIGAVGASLFLGDALITPAISVLSAVEGINVAAPGMNHGLVEPITVVILTLLFAVQSWGTHKVSRFFGPIMTLWFFTLAIMGIKNIMLYPGIFEAFNPYYGINFIISHASISLAVLGGVFLCVTGAEALYTDLGHFGRTPIRTAWSFFVFPALALNYLGQGAMVITESKVEANPFFHMVPGEFTWPLVILSTVATIIASQAVITGAFSLCRQATLLGLLPRLEVRHTSADHMGQIYLPRINGLLFIGVILLVLLFRNSSSLAAAYGVSVCGDMIIGAILAFFVIWKVWNKKVWLSAAIVAPFLLIEIVFLTANMGKLLDGAWATILIAGGIIWVMLTWLYGTADLARRMRRLDMPLDDLIEMLEKHPPLRVPGTAVFLTENAEKAPDAILHNLKHNKILHEHNILLTIKIAKVPRITEGNRIDVVHISDSFCKATINYGYLEQPSVHRTLVSSKSFPWPIEAAQTSFFLSRRIFLPGKKTGLIHWRQILFVGLSRNAWTATDFFKIPRDRVVEIGTQIQL